MPAARPIELQLIEGTRKASNEANDKRREAEAGIVLGGRTLSMPPRIKADPEAASQWRSLARLYRGYQFVSSADVELIGRYCELHSEYVDLTERRRAEVAKGGGKLLSMDYYDALEPILKLDAAIDRRVGQLSTLSDRLLLNPRARIQCVPKLVDKPKSDPLGKAGFGNV